MLLKDIEKAILSPKAQAAIETLIQEQLLTKHVFITAEGSIETVQLDSRVCIFNITYTLEGEKSNG